jgi:hypothetical protein
MGKFEKGNTFSTGRPKGSVNKSTAEIRNFFLQFMGDNLEELRESFKELSANDKFRVILQMSKFVIPQINGTFQKIDEPDFWNQTNNN